jgi:hypothetical protein
VRKASNDHSSTAVKPIKVAVERLMGVVIARFYLADASWRRAGLQGAEVLPSFWE